ncbi:aminoglycoside phosphotransferase family protein [Thalassotalea euphylliae]|uniref:Aminoglycoside phosphotransferase family protein n=1 Tax=Thalassotalea euphylliae TaxID=1655234 RepID=A0A3E0TRB2_9GAMM|nr:phosphotransferase [Thalassotalea euphylliae]REL27003.1 aminoglycoside phosphotransferase family protein [Thalassotalea euphylliae]
MQIKGENINTLVAELSDLPCFIGKELTIEAINTGYSQQVFKIVILDNGHDSQSNDGTTRDEQCSSHQLTNNTARSSRLKCSSETFVAKRFSDKKIAYREMQVQRFLSTQSLHQPAKQLRAPKVVCCHEHWLVSEFIDSPLLDQLPISEKAKLERATAALAKFHDAFSTFRSAVQSTASDSQANLPAIGGIEAVKAELTELDLPAVIRSLANSIGKLALKGWKDHEHLIKQAMKCAIEMQDGFKSHIDESGVGVIHGDLNYANILVTQSNGDSDDTQVCLIDFESVALAPFAYDLGMLMAINCVPPSLTDFCIRNYQNHAINNRYLQCEVVTCYAFISSIINGLWFSEESSCKNEKVTQDVYLAKASAQFAYAKMVYSTDSYLSHDKSFGSR